MFLKNAWYVAAWDHEITRELKQIIVLAEKICVFRTQAGELVGLEDACPHRKLPLSKGRIKGDTHRLRNKPIVEGIGVVACTRGIDTKSGSRSVEVAAGCC